MNAKDEIDARFGIRPEDRAALRKGLGGNADSLVAPVPGAGAS